MTAPLALVPATAVLAATTTPTPAVTPAEDDGSIVAALPTWVSWLLGTPLRVVVTVVVAALVLALVRTAINRATQHIASDRPAGRRGVLGALGERELAGSLLRSNPVAAARRAQRAKTVGSVLRSTASIVVWSIAVVLVLDEVGIPIAPFIASAGIVGVALGFGAQSLVKDFLTGLFMLLEDQYGVGDVVDVGPASGRVEEVGLRVTRLRDDDGTLWYIPNGSMLRVANKTQGWANATVEVDVDYFADLDEVRALLQAAAAHVAADPEVGPAVEGTATVTGIERLSADAVTLRLRLRTQPARQWEVARHLRAAVRERLEAADVPLAGQRDALVAYRERLTAAAGTPTGTEAAPPS